MPFDDPHRQIEIETPNKEEIAILDKMAELLATPDRWCKGAASKTGPKGEVLLCIYAALNVAATGSPCILVPRTAAALRVEISLCDALPRHYPRPLAFNDAPTTTHTDILALITRARRSFE